jgi:two-component system LytT family response regulator
MRLLIVDDESLARARMRQILAGDLGAEIVAECSDATEARAAINAFRPDAVFLDIEMPGTNGLELARELEAAGHPLVVFVTAHMQYAYKAFDVAPVDYVLKPAEVTRCRRALRRLERILAARRSTPGRGGSNGERYLDRVFVKEGDRLVHLPTRDIEAIEALGNYVKLRAHGKTFVVRGTLSSLEGRLNPTRFVRTHRSHIVNVARVRELQPLSHGDYSVLLDSGQTAPLSRLYRDRFQMFVLSSAGERGAE